MADDYTDPLAPPPAAPPKKKRSVLLIILAIMAVLMLVCCGVCGLVGYSFMPTVTKTPQETIALVEKMFTIEIPDFFEAQPNAIEMNNLAFKMRAAKFLHKESQGQMMLMQMKLNFGDANQQVDFETALQKEDSDQNILIDLINPTTETRTFTIRGEEVPFEFIAGEDGQQVKFRQVKGQFPASEGQGLLQLQLQEEAWDEAAIEAMLKSIK